LSPDEVGEKRAESRGASGNVLHGIKPEHLLAENFNPLGIGNLGFSAQEVAARHMELRLFFSAALHCGLFPA